MRTIGVVISTTAMMFAFPLTTQAQMYALAYYSTVQHTVSETQEDVGADEEATTTEIFRGRHLLYPSADTDAFTLLADFDDGNAVSIKVRDSFGSEVYREEIPHAGGDIRTTVDLSTLPSGSFTVTIAWNDKIWVERIVKQ